jgi:hypothetical protein
MRHFLSSGLILVTSLLKFNKTKTKVFDHQDAPVFLFGPNIPCYWSSVGSLGMTAINVFK